MFQPSFWWCRISSIVSHHKRDDSISFQISISLPGGGVPAEGLYHGGLPLCMADEVAYPSDNAAEVPCRADDAWLDGLIVLLCFKWPGRAVGVLFFLLVVNHKKETKQQPDHTVSLGYSDI